MAVYGFDDGNNKKEVYTKQQVISLLQQAIESGTTAGIDPDLAPTPADVEEQHGHRKIKFHVMTEAEYNALDANGSEFIGRIDANGNVYILSDDSALDQILTELQTAQSRDIAWQEFNANYQTDIAAWDARLKAVEKNSLARLGYIDEINFSGYSNTLHFTVNPAGENDFNVPRYTASGTAANDGALQYNITANDDVYCAIAINFGSGNGTAIKKVLYKGAITEPVRIKEGTQYSITIYGNPASYYAKLATYNE